MSPALPASWTMTNCSCFLLDSAATAAQRENASWMAERSWRSAGITWTEVPGDELSMSAFAACRSFSVLDTRTRSLWTPKRRCSLLHIVFHAHMHSYAVLCNSYTLLGPALGQLYGNLPPQSPTCSSHNTEAAPLEQSHLDLILHCRALAS